MFPRIGMDPSTVQGTPKSRWQTIRRESPSRARRRRAAGRDSSSFRSRGRGAAFTSRLRQDGRSRPNREAGTAGPPHQSNGARLIRGADTSQEGTARKEQFRCTTTLPARGGEASARADTAARADNHRHRRRSERSDVQPFLGGGRHIVPGSMHRSEAGGHPSGGSNRPRWHTRTATFSPPARARTRSSRTFWTCRSPCSRKYAAAAR